MLRMHPTSIQNLIFSLFLFSLSGMLFAQPCVPPPASPNVNANTPVCVGETLSLSANNTGITYFWQGPNGFTSEDSVANILNISTAGTGLYSVDAIVAGCTSSVSSTIVISVNPLPASPLASGTTPVCENDILNLNASFVSGASYYWSGPNGFTDNVQNPVLNPVSPAASGVYSVVSIVNACSSLVATQTIVVNPIPAAPVLSSNLPVCSGSSMNLSATGPSGAAYTWTGPNSFTTTVQYPVLSGITLAASGIYSAIAVVSGCSSAVATLNVNVISSPVAISPSSNTPVCESLNIRLSASTAGSGTWYWEGPNAFTSDLQEPLISNAQVNYAGNYTLYAFENGCLSQGTLHYVAVQPAPQVPSIGSNSPVCSGLNLNLSSATVAGANFEWYGPNGFTANTQNTSIPNAGLPEAGFYTLYATVGACTSLGDSTEVLVNISPASAFPSVSTPACTGDQINFSTTDIGSATYLWQGPNGFISTDQYPFIGSAALIHNGIYSLYTIENSCTSVVATTTLLVNPTPVVPTISSNNPVCATTQIQLMAGLLPSAVYHWSGPNGFTSMSQNPVITGANQLNTGQYSLQVSINGCFSDEDTLSVGVVDIPLGVTAFSNSPVCSGDDLQLNVTGIVPGNFQWTGPGGFVSSQTNITLDPAFLSRAGVYQVMYYASGCTVALSSVTVIINPIPSAPIVIFTGGFLVSSISTNIQWYHNNNILPGATLPSLNPTLDGYYMVKYTDPLTGCFNFSQGYFYKSLFVNSDSPLSENPVFSIFPNPVQERVNIKIDLPFLQSNAVMEITDTQGKIILKQSYAELKTIQETIALDTWPSGMYYVRISGSHLMMLGKILKQ